MAGDFLHFHFKKGTQLQWHLYSRIHSAKPGACYDSLRCSWGESRKVFIHCDWTLCCSSSKTLSLSKRFTFFFLTTKPASLSHHSPVTGSSFLSLIMKRDAMLLIIMSLVLACLSQGGCEPQFWETKASISKAPCGCFMFYFLQCSVYAHSPQCAHHITSYPSLRPCSVSRQSLGSCTSLSYPTSCWSVNVLVGNFAWCNNEEILSGRAGYFFVLVVSWNPSMLFYTWKQKAANGVCVLS